MVKWELFTGIKKRRMANSKHKHIKTKKIADKVYSLSKFGVPQERIAEHLNLSVDTLDKYYREELKNASIEANEQVANCLFNKATVENDLGAQIFWLKVRARWRDRDDPEKEQLRQVLAKLLEQDSEEVAKVKKENRELRAMISAMQEEQRLARAGKQ